MKATFCTLTGKNPFVDGSGNWILTGDKLREAELRMVICAVGGDRDAIISKLKSASRALELYKPDESGSFSRNDHLVQGVLKWIRADIDRIKGGHIVFSPLETLKYYRREDAPVGVATANRDSKRSRFTFDWSEFLFGWRRFGRLHKLSFGPISVTLFLKK